MRESADGHTTTGAHADTNLMPSWRQQLGESTPRQLQAAKGVRVRSGVPQRALQRALQRRRVALF